MSHPHLAHDHNVGSHGPLRVDAFLTGVIRPKFGLRAIDRVGAAVLTQSRHWRRCTFALLLRRVVPPPVGIWIQPGSCAQYK